MHFPGKPHDPDSFSFSVAVLCGGPVFAAADVPVVGVVAVVVVFGCCVVVEGVVASAGVWASRTGSVDVGVVVVGAAVVDGIVDASSIAATAAILDPTVSP